MYLFFFYVECLFYLQSLFSFPTRRSSDLSVDKFLRIFRRFDHFIFGDVLRVMAVAEQGGQLGYRHYAEYRSEEHTSELQSRGQLVCRLLLEKKKIMLLILFINASPTFYGV